MRSRGESLSPLVRILSLGVVAPILLACADNRAGNLFSPSVPSPTPGPAGPYLIVGNVSELVGGVPTAVSGVDVHDEVRHVSVTTATDGSYRISGVETYQGSVYLSFSKTGYNTVRRTFPLTGEQTWLDVQLDRH